MKGAYFWINLPPASRHSSQIHPDCSISKLNAQSDQQFLEKGESFMRSNDENTHSNSERLVYNPLNPFYPDESEQIDKPVENKRIGWNPFAPTSRDIKRTEQLAQKSMVITVLLGLIFPVIGLFYLGRGANAAKFFAYTVSLGLIVAIAGGPVVKPEELGRASRQIAALLSGIEQIICVSEAKKRNQQRTK